MARKKKCPNPSCTFEFTNAVIICPLCRAQIGSSTSVAVEGAPKTARKCKPTSKHPTVYVGDGVFSVQYWQFNRCFVRAKTNLFDTGDDTNFCTKWDCSEKRRLAIRNSEQFDCPHIQKVIQDLETKQVKLT